MPSAVEDGWRVEWAAETRDNGYRDMMVLTRDQAEEYGDRLVYAIHIDGEILREWDLDPAEPFVWRISNGDIITEQITRNKFEQVANSDHEDAFYAKRVLKYRAERRQRRLDRGDPV
ncbi:hypothetical protein [Halorubrum coriense]|uniref:hypothetical protein n=1 Tax=Halorubrum coriense TaxID=64713 RepID=UPI0009B5A14F|nr:hypothetical protein [Halorubrum coriense]